MFCYIKSYDDFKTIAKYEVLSYSFSEGETSNATVYDDDPLRVERKYLGCWMIVFTDEKYEQLASPYMYTATKNTGNGYTLDLNNLVEDYVQTRELSSGGIRYDIWTYKTFGYKHNIYYISDIHPEENIVTINLESPYKAFSRKIFNYVYAGYEYYSGDGKLNYSKWIEDVLNNEFGTNCPDPLYKLSYLKVHNYVTSTDKINEEVYGDFSVDQTGFVDPSEVIESAIQSGLLVDFGLSYDENDNEYLLCTISSVQNDTEIILFNDGHATMAHEEYKPEKYSKLTIAKSIDAEVPIIQDKFADTYGYSSKVKAYAGIEISQRVFKSAGDNYNFYFKARLHIVWNRDSSITDSITYGKGTYLKIKGPLYTDSSSDVLLDAKNFEWTRSEDPGDTYTDWFNLKAIKRSKVADMLDSLGISFDTEINLYGAVGDEDAPTPQKLTASVQLATGNFIKPEHVYYSGSDSYTQINEYYLDGDGNVTESVPTNRTSGLWGQFEAEESSFPLEWGSMRFAKAIFASNTEGHKIEFYSDKYYRYGQLVRIKRYGNIIDSIIVSRTQTSDNNLYYYKCGNLVTTLTERISNLEDKI